MPGHGLCRKGAHPRGPPAGTGTVCQHRQRLFVEYTSFSRRRTVETHIPPRAGASGCFPHTSCSPPSPTIVSLHPIPPIPFSCNFRIIAFFSATCLTQCSRSSLRLDLFISCSSLIKKRARPSRLSVTYASFSAPHRPFQTCLTFTPALQLETGYIYWDDSLGTPSYTYLPNYVPSKVKLGESRRMRVKMGSGSLR